MLYPDPGFLARPVRGCQFLLPLHVSILCLFVGAFVMGFFRAASLTRHLGKGTHVREGPLCNLTRGSSLRLRRPVRGSLRPGFLLEFIRCIDCVSCLSSVLLHRGAIRLAIAPLAVASRTITGAYRTSRAYVSANELSGSAPAMWDRKVFATCPRIPVSLIANGITFRMLCYLHSPFVQGPERVVELSVRFPVVW